MATHPLPDQSKRTNLYDAMIKYMGKAIQNREEFYAGVAEAKADFENQVDGSPYKNAGSAHAAEQLFQLSPKGKELIGNNRWHMMQAVMFGVGALAGASINIYQELRRIRKLLEQSERIPTQRRGE